MSILQILRRGAVASSMCCLVYCGGDDANVPNTALVRIDDEAPGANCPDGGLAIVSGIDGDKNGALDANEVIAAQTRYVCTPAASQVLTAIDTNVAVSDCPYGGDRVRSGFDTNGNSVLDDAEVTSSSFACNPQSIASVFFGDMTVASTDDLAQLDGITIITGGLVVRTKGDLSIPAIVIVGGAVTIDVGTTTGVDSVLTMPDLTRAGSVFLTSGTINAAQLREVSNTLGYGAATFNGGPTVGLTLPSLERVQAIGLAPVFGGGALALLSLPALRVASEISIGNSLLATVELPALQSASSISINSSALTELNLPALTAVNTFQLSNNGVLTTLNAPLLASIATSLSVIGNGSLNGCVVQEIEVQTIPTGHRYNVGNFGNGAATGCATNTAASCGTLTIDGAPSRFHLCLAPNAAEADAEEDCSTLFGGHAASFASADEAAKVKAALPFDAWIGFTDVVEGTWSWTDATTDYLPTTSDTTFWAATEPNGSTGENCAVMVLAGVVDTSCTSSSFPVLCREP